MPIFGAINSLIQSGQQKRAASRINPVNSTYVQDPAIAGLYAEGKNLYQGRMPGATQAEQGISTGEANATAFAERNATDASQLLSFGAGVYGQGNDARVNLAVKEAEDKQNRFGIYSSVSQLLNQERDKVFQDKLRKYYDDLNYKRALEGAAMQNKANAWQGLDQNILSVASLFSPGGAFAGKSGGGGQTTTQSANYPASNSQTTYGRPPIRQNGGY